MTVTLTESTGSLGGHPTPGPIKIGQEKVDSLRRFDTFEAKLIFFRITSCVQRSLHPEQESTIFYGGHQPN